MDLKSYQWANHLLQNPPQSVSLEFSQPGLQITFDQQTFISLAGGQAEVFVNEQPIYNPSLICITPGDVLKIGAFQKGQYFYLCIAGGFITETYLDSGSDFESVTESASKKTGETLFYKPRPKILDQKAKVKWNSSWFDSPIIEVHPGPDWSLLTSGQQMELKSRTFQLSKNRSRMGIQLEELYANKLPDLPTNPVFPGTVQLTPSGKIIVLMRDAGVTGGYPRILQLTEDSINRLAQKKTGDSISFQLI
jgi:allophanate hydrolase subunit 2